MEAYTGDRWRHCLSLFRSVDGHSVKGVPAGAPGGHIMVLARRSSQPTSQSDYVGWRAFCAICYLRGSGMARRGGGEIEH